MVEVGVSDVDRGQASVVERHPVGERGSLADGAQRVDKDSVGLTVNQGRTGRIPGRRIADISAICPKEDN